MNDPSKSLCIHKWGFPTINLYNKEYKYCCNNWAYRKIDDIENFEEILNSDYEKQRRLEMFKGVQHSDCRKCWDVERRGGISLRIKRNEIFEQHYANELMSEFGTTDLKKLQDLVTIDSKIISHISSPHRLEIKLGNVCDLKCIYCGPDSSSRWIGDHLKTGKISKEKASELRHDHTPEDHTNQFWQWFNNVDKSRLRFISIVGGEPTISPEFSDWANKLLSVFGDIPRKQIILSITTNGNTKHNQLDEFMDGVSKLSRIFTVNVNVSIENTHRQAEFVRTNLSWDRLEKNMDTFLTSKHIDNVFLASSTTVLSLPSLPEFLKWRKNLMDKHNRIIYIGQNIVRYPSYLFPFILPNTFVRYVDEAINFFDTNESEIGGSFFKQQYIQYLNGLKTGLASGTTEDSSTLAEFYKNMNKLSEDTGENFTDIFPKLKSFYSHCMQIHQNINH